MCLNNLYKEGLINNPDVTKLLDILSRIALWCTLA